MFLNSLNPTEKDNFMKLAVAVIKADGVVEESEKQILSAYANEMQIPVCNLDEQCDADSIHQGICYDFDTSNKTNYLFRIAGIGVCRWKLCC